MVIVCLERRCHRYVSNSSIKTQSIGAFRFTTGTCTAKLRPTDAQVAAFRPHVTICSRKGLTLIAFLQNVLTEWDCPRHHTPCLPIGIPVYTKCSSGATLGHMTHCCIMLGPESLTSSYKDTRLAGRVFCPDVLVGSDCIQRLKIEPFACILFYRGNEG
jgi:hypothetical protein